jgi:glycosyltransferase involved in cell wall biosynthesis
MRLGIYTDAPFRSDGEVVSTRFELVGRFFPSLAGRVDDVVIFGRLDPAPAREPYALPARVAYVPLPYYPSVFDVVGVVRALAKSRATFTRHVLGLDALWLFGPGPMSMAFARSARAAGVPLVLGVRQDYPAYIRHRLPNRRWGWALAGAYALEFAFRRLAANTPTVVLGEGLAAKYAGSAPRLVTAFSLFGRDDVLPRDVALARRWDGQLRVLVVSRIDREKNPFLLLEIIEGLRARDPRWQMAIVGDGPLLPELQRRIRERGLTDAVELRGYVENGRPLWREYHTSHAFLHVALTEGLPQTLAEANAAGLPIVATAVGGVAAAVARSSSGFAVPPRDAHAAVDALERIRTDVTLRERLVSAGLEYAAGETLESHLDRVAGFIREHAVAPGSGTRRPLRAHAS